MTPPGVDVLFAVMPFGPVSRPSLGVTLLADVLRRDHGVRCDIRYFNLLFANEIGLDLYVRVADGFPSSPALVGEWLFSRALSRNPAVTFDDYEAFVLRTHAGGDPSVLRAFLGRMRDSGDCVEAFLDRCAAEVLDARPRIVGLTSVFQQHAASLALARRLKESAPDVLIALGGPNCEGEMGLQTLRAFPFVDIVVSGEGEIAFPEIVTLVLAGKRVSARDGVYVSAALPAAASNAPRLANLDTLPYPDFSSYFVQFDAAGFRTRIRPRLLFEGSRGCWWGQKHHCTFCGLNGSSMGYRKKSPDRAVNELLHLAKTHDTYDVSFADNILEMSYVRDVMPRLAELGPRLDLFCEVKANLRPDQLRALKHAGVNALQPGLESLSDDVLALMAKGTTAVQNILVLRSCKELAIRPHWNLLWGFPRERPDAYARMAELVPLLHHLPPPLWAGPIRLDRFSPHFERAADFGFVNVRAAEAYRYVYPDLSSEALFNVAYFFDCEYRDERRIEEYTGELVARVVDWQRCHADSELLVMVGEGDAVVFDFRDCAEHRLYRLGERARAVYFACEEPIGLQHLQECLTAARPGRDVDPSGLERCVDELIGRKLLVESNGRYVALAVRLGEYVPQPRIVERMRVELREGDADILS